MNNKTSNIYPWVVVGLLWGVALLNYMDRQMLSTMRIPMMEDVRELESAANFGRLMAVLFVGFPNIPDNEIEVIPYHVAEILIITDMGSLQHL